MSEFELLKNQTALLREQVRDLQTRLEFVCSTSKVHVDIVAEYQVVLALCKKNGIPYSSISSNTHQKRIVEAKRLIIRELDARGWSQGRIARAMICTISTVSEALKTGAKTNIPTSKK